MGGLGAVSGGGGNLGWRERGGRGEYGSVLGGWRGGGMG